jgi:hypothetical protein
MIPDRAARVTCPMPIQTGGHGVERCGANLTALLVGPERGKPIPLQRAVPLQAKPTVQDRYGERLWLLLKNDYRGVGESRRRGATCLAEQK